MKHNPLLAQLRAAFPPAKIIAETAFVDRGRFYCDANEYRLALDDKTWEELDPVYVARRSDALFFLGDEHFLAVLPMYLHLMIVFRPTSPIPESLVPELTRPFPSDDWTTAFELQPTLYECALRKFEGYTRLLTRAQNEVVTATLLAFIAEWPHEGDPARVALERYWAAFAKPQCRQIDGAS